MKDYISFIELQSQNMKRAWKSWNRRLPTGFVPLDLAFAMNARVKGSWSVGSVDECTIWIMILPFGFPEKDMLDARNPVAIRFERPQKKSRLGKKRTGKGFSANLGYSSDIERTGNQTKQN